uniref:Uncharacterized protein n=1 Tax=Peronospora matthiolae TaxID=2874970 RepID=A0AAV1VDT9_9STRA
MPRPILKTLSSYASPVRSASSASKKERKRVPARRPLNTSRHVTFSPFTKLRGGSPTKSRRPLHTDGKKTMGSLTSGFTFSSATEAEKKKQLRRKEELRTMQLLHRAAMRRPHSIKSLLLKNVPGLQRVYTSVNGWLDYVRAVRDSIPWLQRSRPKRRPRRLHRRPRTALNEADHMYLQQLPLHSTVTRPTLLLPLPMTSRGNGCEALSIFYSSRQPDLTPASRGSFANLLRRKGIPVDEDERQAKRAIDEDLLGVRHLAKRRRIH